jgi:FixJ family two-component response regulator
MNTPKEKNNEALIAIVDDDQSFREALESLLKLIGFRTAIFASARNFLDSPQFPNVSCAILDVSMPEMDGLELQRHLLATHPSPPSSSRISGTQRHESRRFGRERLNS